MAQPTETVDLPYEYAFFRQAGRTGSEIEYPAKKEDRRIMTKSGAKTRNGRCEITPTFEDSSFDCLS